MIASVHQPHYLPWLGYFDKIDSSDVFVILDNVQYKKREFQNRNRIKTAAGVLWLTVPVVTRGRYYQTTGEVGIDNTEDWRANHLRTLELNYSRAPHFDEYFPGFAALMNSRQWETLAELSVAGLRFFMGKLGISVPIRFEKELGVPGEKTERIINICRAVGADTYLSGAGGKAYMDEPAFERAGIGLRYQHFEHPVYPQLHGAFEPYMAAPDLMLNAGGGSLEIIRSGRRAS
jgi:hypothetical protein